MNKKTVFFLPTLLLFTTTLPAVNLYKVKLIRAAPGELINLIDFYRSYFKAVESAGDPRPFWMRHSQGDQWDLLILMPLDSFTAYYSRSRAEARTEAVVRAGLGEDDGVRRWRQLVAWHADLLVEGPPLQETRRAFQKAGFFHVEMFRALPGRYRDLLDQRRRENVYLEKLDRPQNLIFKQIEGAPWDCFTIGFYRDLKHFAESVDIPKDREDEAAKAAGFESAAAIGPFLRTLIAEHHDTLAVAVR